MSPEAESPKLEEETCRRQRLLQSETKQGCVQHQTEGTKDSE